MRSGASVSCGRCTDQELPTPLRRLFDYHPLHSGITTAANSFSANSQRSAAGRPWRRSRTSASLTAAVNRAFSATRSLCFLVLSAAIRLSYHNREIGVKRDFWLKAPKCNNCTCARSNHADFGGSGNGIQWLVSSLAPLAHIHDPGPSRYAVVTVPFPANTSTRS